jgi:hypothetical protein
MFRLWKGTNVALQSSQTLLFDSTLQLNRTSRHLAVAFLSHSLGILPVGRMAFPQP